MWQIFAVHKGIVILSMVKVSEKQYHALFFVMDRNLLLLEYRVSV